MDFLHEVFQKLSSDKHTSQSKAKAKARNSYIAHLTGKPDQPRFTIIEVAVDRANGAVALNAAIHCTR